MGNWRSQYDISHVLTEIKKEMCTSANKKLAQPPEGTMY